MLELANQGALDTEVKAHWQEVARDAAFQRAAATSVLGVNDAKVDETTTPATRSLSSGLLTARAWQPDSDAEIRRAAALPAGATASIVRTLLGRANPTRRGLAPSMCTSSTTLQASEL